MAAFDQADTVRRLELQAIVEEMFYPWAGGVYQAFGAPGKGFAAVDVDGFHHPQAIFAPGAGHFGAGADFATAFGHGLGVQHDQARIVYPTVRIFETAL
ncbi:hypothetical protein D3C78_1663000 [compost metagenome]